MRLTNLVVNNKIETIKSSVKLETELRNVAMLHWIASSRGDLTKATGSFCPPPLMYEVYDVNEDDELEAQSSFNNDMEHPGGIGFELQYLDLID